MTAYRPLDSRCVRGVASCGEVNRRNTGGMRSRICAAAETSSARGRATGTSRGVRSWSRVRWPDDRLGVETAPHHPIVQDIRDRDQRHALVMRHIGPHDGDVFSFGHPCAGVIQCLIEPVGPLPPASASRAKSCVAAGSIMAASAAAYGATTTSSLRPRLSPRPGTPKLEYWYVRSRSRAL